VKIILTSGITKETKQKNTTKLVKLKIRGIPKGSLFWTMWQVVRISQIKELENLSCTSYLLLQIWV